MEDESKDYNELDDLTLSDDEYENLLLKHKTQTNLNLPDHPYHKLYRYYSPYMYVSDNDMLFKQTILNLIISYDKNPYHKLLLNDYSLVDFRCFMCKCDIKIDVNNINETSFFCKKHSPEKITKGIRNNPNLIRYMDIFYRKIKSTILNNEQKFLSRKERSFYE